MTTPHTPASSSSTPVYHSIGEAAQALGSVGVERVILLGRSVDLAEEDMEGRGWLDLHSDAACLGVKIEVEPHPGGKVWVVRN